MTPFDWSTLHQDFIFSFEDVVAGSGQSTDAAHISISTDTGGLKSSLAVTETRAIPNSGSLNGVKNSAAAASAPGQLSSLETSAFSLGAPNGSLEGNKSTWPRNIQRRRQLLRVSPRAPSLASLERMASLVYQNSFTRNIEPNFSWPVSAAQSRQFSDDSLPPNWFASTGTFSQTFSPAQGSEPQIPHWFSPTVMFSQPRPPTQAHQLPDDAPPENRFLPTMMNTPTPPFNFSLPPTPQLFHTSPPAMPGQHSPATALYPDFGGLRDPPTSPGLFGIQLPPLRLSSSPAPGS